MKYLYTFPAIFETNDDGISIYFPDLPGCLPCADNMEEAFANAKEALQLHLYGMEEDGEPIPEPTFISQLHPKTNQCLTIIEAWMPPFREKMINKSTNKTVTIPRWLDILAKKNNVNYSHLLQASLQQYLKLRDSTEHHFNDKKNATNC